jgi:hypothetical protein
MPLAVSTWSLCCVTGLGIVFFLVFAIPPFGFVHPVVSLVFVFGVPFLCDESSFVGCFSFVGFCPLVVLMEPSILLSSLSLLRI